MADQQASSSQPDSNLLALASAAAIVGGLILAATFVATIPAPVVGIGSLLFLLGLLLAFVFGYRASRRESSSFGQAIGGGLRTLWRWLWPFMP